MYFNKFLLLSFILILSSDLEIKPQEAPTNNQNFFQKGFDKFRGYWHATLGHDTEFKTPFSRGPGYWSNQRDGEKTGVFNRLVQPESQREDWYSVTPYISEFWCATSNIGFIAVGLHYRSPEIMLAGLASFTSHSCPKQWLLRVDQLGIALVLLKLGREYQILKENPYLLALPVAAGAINLADMYLGRYKGKTWPHVVWHLSAAAIAAYYLSHLKK